MALSGNLREFALSEVLQLLSSQRKTGALRLTRGNESRVLYLLEGRIASVRDRGFEPGDPLAAFLRRIRRLSDEQLRGIASIHTESNRDLVDLLLNGRYLEREELSLLYERLALDVLHELLGWEDGTYSFSTVSPPETVLPISLSSESMLMESVRRLDEFRRYSQQLSDTSLVLGLRELPDPDADLSEEEKELFGLVDGRRTLGEVVNEASLTDYEAYEALFRLVEAGWIELTGRRAADSRPPAEPARRLERKRIWTAETMLAGACMVAVITIAVIAHKSTRPSALEPRSAEEDVFERLRERDVRFALELFRRTRGVYPERLDELVRDGWLTRAQIRPGPWKVDYARSDDGSSYSLGSGPRL